MRRAFYLPLVFLTGLFASVVFGAAQANAEDRELQGSWQVVSLFHEGERVPSNGFYVGVLIYDNKIVFDNQTFEAKTFTYRTNRRKSPMHLDIFDDQDKEPVKKAVFNLQQGVLQICLGDPRPTEFETAKSDGRRLFVLERKAKK